MNGANDARSAALPPDLRKVSDLPRGEFIFFPGAMPRIIASISWGVAPTNLSLACRKVTDLPHISRQSRKD
jgi:hypothetical protein